MTQALTLGEAVKKLMHAREIVAQIRDNMIKSGKPKFVPLIQRGEMLLINMDSQIESLRQMHQPGQATTLGVVWLAPVAWIAGAAALTAATKWVTDAYQTQSYENLAQQYGPERASAMMEARQQTPLAGTLKNLAILAGVVIVGFVAMRMLGR